MRPVTITLYSNVGWGDEYIDFIGPTGAPLDLTGYTFQLQAVNAITREIIAVGTTTVDDTITGRLWLSFTTAQVAAILATGGAEWGVLRRTGADNTTARMVAFGQIRSGDGVAAWQS